MANTTRQWQIAAVTGIFRVGVGVSLIATRGFGARVFGAERDDAFMPALLAAFGARDGLLGLSALGSTRPGADVSTQVKLQAANDVLDAAVIGGLIAAGRIPKGRGSALVGVSLAAAVGDYATARLAARPAGLSLTG